MPWSLKWFSISLVIGIAYFSPGSALPLPALDLSALTKNSSLIVVGQVASIREIGADSISIQGKSYPAKKNIADVKVFRTLKGQPINGVVAFEFITTRVFLGLGDIFVNQAGVFFLSQNNSQDYTVTDMYYPSVIATTRPPAPVVGDYKRVIAEISNVLALRETTSDEKLKAISLLDRVVTADASSSLRLAANSVNSNIKYAAIAALLKRNDITRINVAEKALLQPSRGIDPRFIGGLAFSLQSIKDTKAIPTLARLLDSPHVEARRSAAYALRKIGGGKIIRPLTKALNDNDRDVRYQAVMGLATAAKQDSQAPSIELYGANETQYLDFWKDWARKH